MSGSSKDIIKLVVHFPMPGIRRTSVYFTDPSGLYNGTYFVAAFKVTDVSRGTFVKFDYLLPLRIVTSVNAQLEEVKEPIQRLLDTGKREKGNNRKNRLL